VRVADQMGLLVWELEQIGLFAVLSWEMRMFDPCWTAIQGDESGTPMHRVVK
jgi:hypothetical protein